MLKIWTILSIFTLLSCSADPVDTVQPEENMNTENKLKYLALGDSYTIGQSVPESDRFPVLLVDTLKGLGFDYASPQIIARTGWTTDELDEAIQAADIQDTFSLVTLLIGVNNQYRGREVEEFRTQFADLLTQAIHFAGDDPERVIVVSIPDWGVSPFAQGRDRSQIAQEIDQFNAVKREETLKKGVRFVDITGISRSGFEKPDYFAPDGLHFSGLMHQLWVNEIVRVFLEQ